jgi:hypothetical protein
MLAIRLRISGWKRHSVIAAITTTMVQRRAPDDRRRDLGLDGGGGGVATGGSTLGRLTPPKRGAVPVALARRWVGASSASGSDRPNSALHASMLCGRSIGVNPSAPSTAARNDGSQCPSFGHGR